MTCIFKVGYGMAEISKNYNVIKPPSIHPRIYTPDAGLLLPATPSYKSDCSQLGQPGLL